MRRPGRRLRRAAVLSLLLNLATITLVTLYYHNPDVIREKMSATETVTIERVRKQPHAPEKAHVLAAAAAAKAARVAPRQVAQVPKPVPVPIPVPQHHVLVAPPVAARPAATSVRKPIVPKHAVVASIEHPAAVQAGPARLSANQIASITNGLGAAIAADRDRENPLAVHGTGGVSPMKHYGMDADSLASDAIGHHGLCDPTKSWNEGNWDYYYVTCRVHATDGTTDEESVPWPVRFKPDADPFQGTLGAKAESPLAMPLPGWHLSPGEYVADGVRQYAESHGVNL